jgi:hypothetical protein
VYDHLSPLAQRLGAWLATQCTEGMPRGFGDELLDAFPDADAAALRAALAELKAEGFVTLSGAIGPKLPRTRTTYALFAAADPTVTRQDPVRDAVIIARMLIQDPKKNGIVRDLDRDLGWERRRFNPALGQLLDLFPSKRRSNETQNDYPTRQLLVLDDEVIALQRFIKAHTR